MTWAAVAILAAGTYVLKAAAPLALGGRPLPEALRDPVRLLPAAVLAALVAVQTFAEGAGLTIDARVAGVAAAGLAALRGAPFPVIVVVAMLVSAVVRALI